ncbi:MAG: hypothetical protein K2J44_06605, partial [Ruminococcus sp.]|nr:hypothetical protein [Ruminococcus sp.]
IRCGRNLENSQEVNYEQVGMSGYHTEEEYSQKKNEFKMSASTFTINDRHKSYISSELFTSDELNALDETDFSEHDELLVSNPYADKFSEKNMSLSIDDIKSEYADNKNEIDFGGHDEPLVSNPYTDSVSAKTQSMRAMDMQSNYINQSENELDFGGRDEPLAAQPVSVQQNNVVNSSPLPSQPYMNANPYFNQIYGVPTVNEALPQIIGYDTNGMPIYSQPAVTYAPPQIIGYDPNGMPIYAQSPVTYAPPQIMGYDPSGMPIYAQQPVLYQQPSMPQFQSVSEQLQKNQNVDSVNNDISDKFRDFIDDGKSKKKSEKSENDFFGKSSDMGDISVAGLDVGSLKKRDDKKKTYMNETPLVNADGLVPNNASKFNKMYMKQTEKVNAENLEEKKTYGANHIMRATKEVDANKLNAKKSYKSYMTMSGAGEADANQLEAYVPKAKKSIMAEADHAVEAMPKKKPKYVDELDKIELPEYMQAKKTVKSDTPAIPELPEL